MVLSNAMIAVWARAVQAEVPQSFPDAFADDAGALAHDADSVQEVINVTAEFARLTKARAQRQEELRFLHRSSSGLRIMFGWDFASNCL